MQDELVLKVLMEVDVGAIARVHADAMCQSHLSQTRCIRECKKEAQSANSHHLDRGIRVRVSAA
jgi:hypothetical protein